MSNMVSGEQYNPEMREQAELARRRDQQKNMTLELGGLLHDEWRSSRLQDNGSYEPRMKLLVQRGEKQKWINESDLQPNDQEIKRQDIANTDFADLEPHWQADNQAAAEVAMGIVFQAVDEGKTIDPTSSAFIEQASEIIHNEWMKRRPWEPQGQGNMVPYDQLTEPVKDEDRKHILFAMQVYLKHQQ